MPAIVDLGGQYLPLTAGVLAPEAVRVPDEPDPLCWRATFRPNGESHGWLYPLRSRTGDVEFTSHEACAEWIRYLTCRAHACDAHGTCDAVLFMLCENHYPGGMDYDHWLRDRPCP